MTQVIMYCTASCPYCDRARRLLSRKGVRWEEIRVDLEPQRRVEMETRSGRTSVPQIFIDDFHVGGYDDMAALDSEQGLDPLLSQP